MNRLGRPWGAILIALVLGAAIGWGYYAATRPVPEIPVPADLERLEPQLKAYIKEKVAWVREAPRKMDRHATLGLVYAANSLWPEARKAFQNAIELNPREPLAHMYEGVAAEESGDLAAALAKYRELTTRFPSFAPGFYRLGHASLRTGDAAGAESAFARLAQLAPGEWRAYAGIGEAKLRQGDHEGAVRQLERAVQLAPHAKSAHHLLGLAYRGLGRVEEAEMELSLGINPIAYPMPDPWSETVSQHMKLIQDQVDMANELALAGRPERAVEILRTALFYNPTNLTVLNNLAIAYNRAGQPQQGKAILLKALEMDPQYLPAYVTLSFSCHGAGRFEEALDWAEKAVALSPDTAQAHLAKANALLAMERDLEALESFGSALRLDPQNAEIHLEMGDVCRFNLQRAGEALEHYEKAVALDPVFVAGYLRIAEVYLEQERTNEARQAIEKLRRLASGDPVVAELEVRAGMRGAN